MNKFLHEHKDFQYWVSALNKSSGIPTSFIIKDYWVTEILRVLHGSDLNGKFIFKGGTSLSKALNLIERFSEDIDLLFIGEDLGKNSRRKMMKKAEMLTADLPGIKYDDTNPDNISTNDHKTSCFIYPSKDISGVKPFIKLEMGFRGGIEPSKNYKIESIIASALLEKNASLKKEFTGLDSFEVCVLDPFRTMIEKIFSLHRAYFDGRLQDKERHLYDIYCLLKEEYITTRLATKEHLQIKKDVANYDKLFNNEHIPKDLSFADSPVFTKGHSQCQVVKTAYQTSQIYYGKRPDFDEMIDFIIGFSAKF